MRSLLKLNRSQSESGTSDSGHSPLLLLRFNKTPKPASGAPHTLPSIQDGPSSSPGASSSSAPRDAESSQSAVPAYSLPPDIPSYETATANDVAFNPAFLRNGFGSNGPGPLVDEPLRSPTARPPSFLTSPVALADADEDDDPLVPRTFRQPPPPSLRPLRRATFAGPTDFTSSSSAPDPRLLATVEEVDPVVPVLPIDVPLPPASELPVYSPHLGRDELRLISAVHLDQNHPAAAYFNAIAASSTASTDAAESNPEHPGISTGGRKLKLTLRRGGERMNVNGTGPVYCRLGRKGTVSGTIMVGKVDHVVGLEVSIVGLVNTSYYVRGQYTLIDTLPLGRRRQILYPPGVTSSDSTTDNMPFGDINPAPATVGVPAGGVTPAGTQENTTASIPPTTSASTLSPLARLTSMVAIGSPAAQASSESAGASTTDADIVAFMNPDTSFEFTLGMPNGHYRDETVELPPTCQILQVGMQAGIEYLLRIKLSRKGWRMNETMTLPIIYEPRAFIPPRRLRALTTNDALNPGWRTIRLHGGTPKAATTSTGVAASSPGVEVTLLLPSPPIVFIAHGAAPPTIPFHLHFHSILTHALATISEPRNCTFIIRLMRVTAVRIGLEREVRRFEIPCSVQIWQEGGPRLTLGEDEPQSDTQPSGGATQAATEGNVSTSPSTERRPSTLANRRPSWLRRRSTSTQRATIPAPEGRPSGAAETVPVIPESPTALPSVAHPVVAPLSLDATDVHLLGELTIDIKPGPDMHRRLLQSFQTPEIGISYVLEVGLQPNKGSVREAFEHVWGGGLVEVVHGAKP